MVDLAVGVILCLRITWLMGHKVFSPKLALMSHLKKMLPRDILGWQMQTLYNHRVWWILSTPNPSHTTTHSHWTYRMLSTNSPSPSHSHITSLLSKARARRIRESTTVVEFTWKLLGKNGLVFHISNTVCAIPPATTVQSDGFTPVEIIFWFLSLPPNTKLYKGSGKFEGRLLATGYGHGNLA